MRILYIAYCPSPNMGLIQANYILSKSWVCSCIFKHSADDSLKVGAFAVVWDIEFFPRKVSAVS